MQSIEFNREAHPIVNQIYNTLSAFKIEERHITLCKVPIHMGIKGDKFADTATSEAMGIPETTARLLSYYYYNKEGYNFK